MVTEPTCVPWSVGALPLDFCFVPLTLILNAIASGLILYSYKYVAWNPSSLIYRLNFHVLSPAPWGYDGVEARQSARQLSAISTIIAGIALATVAFITSITVGEIMTNAIRIEIGGGILVMLWSAIFAFWGLGMSSSVSEPQPRSKTTEEEEKKKQERMQAFKNAYFLISFAIYLWFNGLLWALSVLSPFFMLGTAACYFFLFFVLYKHSKKLSN
jgi:hypothetical protein